MSSISEKEHFTIRQMTLEDLKLVMTWANEEGWYFADEDAEAFFNADPNGFFIGEVNGTPVTSFAAIKYESYCFWDLFIVKEEYRGKGYGSKIFEHARNYSKDSQVLGLDASGSLITFYAKYGFKSYFNTISYTRKASGVLCNSLVDLRSISIDDLTEYDLRVFEYPRKKCLESFLNQRSSYCLGSMKDGKLNGYAVLRKADVGYLVGPLCADDSETAEKLLDGLQSYVLGETVYMEIFDCNEKSKDIVSKQGWEHLMTYSRMYARDIPKIDMEKLYCPVDEIS